MEFDEWNLKTVEGERVYNLDGDHVRTNVRGFYLIFYGTSKLRETDFIINQSLNHSVLQLGFNPTEAGIPLNVLYLGELINASDS